jgi:arylsulfatase A-like enzyme
MSGALALLSAALLTVSPARADRQPNVVLIITDDQGSADAGFLGSKDLLTPNMDALAASGAICRQGYVTFPVCSPSRVGLLTGRHGARVGYHTNPPDSRKHPAPDTAGLPFSEVTLPERLKSAGYTTGIVGKWHLGAEPLQHPLKRGFDSFYGFVGGGHHYWQWKTDASKTYQAPIYNETEIVEGAEQHYLTDLLTAAGVRFIEKSKDKPFFLYLAYNAPHTPMQATPELLARVPNLTGKRQTYAAMLLAVDDGIGQIRAKVRELGLENDTIYVFVSDNGGPINDNASSNGALRGQKSQVWEGGIRVPFVVAWPGKIAAGTRFDKPVSTLDLAPTVLTAAGVDVKGAQGLEGVDLLPYLTGKVADAPHQRLFWYHVNKSWAVRQGDWKLVSDPKGDRHLFNLAADPTEKTNLLDQQPAMAAELEKAFNEWNASNGTRLPWETPK